MNVIIRDHQGFNQGIVIVVNKRPILNIKFNGAYKRIESLKTIGVDEV